MAELADARGLNPRAKEHVGSSPTARTNPSPAAGTRAEAVRVYTQQAKLGKKAENAAAEIRLRAERRVGELLRQTDLRRVNPSRREGLKLADQGLSAKESPAFQRMVAELRSKERDRRTAARPDW